MADNSNAKPMTHGVAGTAIAPPVQPFSRVAVVGCGWMGGQIARVYAAAGLTVYLADTDPAAVRRTCDNLRRWLDQAAPDDSDARRGRVVQAGLDELDEVEFVQEAVVEDMQVKQQLFAELGQRLAPSIILATNTSRIRISEIAARCRDPARVLGVHWVSPAYIIPVVEIVPGPETASGTVDASCDFLRSIGRRPVICRKEIPGFLVNRIKEVLVNEALDLVAGGYASAEDVDAVVRWSIAPRMALWGPLRAQDLQSNKKTVLAVAQYLYEQTGDQRFRPPRLLQDAVAAGHLGIVSGRGYYSYEGLDKETLMQYRDQSLIDILAYLEGRDDRALQEGSG